MNFKKILLPLAILTFIASYFYFDLSRFFTLEYFQENLASFHNYYNENPWPTIAIFSTLYISSTALALPIATPLTLLAGALFGLATGTIIVSFASTIGATLAFLAARYIFRDLVQKRFHEKLKTFNQGIEKDGKFYLLTLRLIPIFPFFLINTVMGLTPMKTVTYYIFSQLGMLPGTIVYVNAGLKISELKSYSGILSLEFLLAFALLGIFPYITKGFINYFKKKKVYKSYRKPKKFDYNMVVIGAGAAGLVTSYICAAVKAKVALIEKHEMGGDCLNTGCVPSKAIIRSSKVAHLKNKAVSLGFDSIQTTGKFKSIMERVHRVIKNIEPHDSVERYQSLGVECIQGSAKIVSPWEVEVNGKKLTTKNITIASGASPFVPPIKGLESVPYLTSNTLWNLNKLPENFLVIGGGPIGLEMAQAFNRLGSKVTVVELGSRVMIKEDPDVSQFIQERLEKEGIRILTHTKLEAFSKEGEKPIAHLEKNGEKSTLHFDYALLSIGRRANTKGFGLEELGIELNANGTIATNEYLQTKYPNIYACGDVAGPYQLTHMASHQAWFCAVNALFGRFKKFKADYSVVPWATYTDPEVATVGHTEQSAKEQGIEYTLSQYPLDDLDRAIADEEAYGFIKVLTAKSSDKILGATIVGSQASTMLVEFVLAMKYGLGLNKILGTIHVYPSMGEGNKYVAGRWKQAQTSPKTLSYLEKFHQWSRS
ncbi:MAG: dihydrolipoyl dehydrogenase [Halobacteriovoraceae bacterium]|nr:dihydrolipoyl dehydrogenase [Halobacteriovoraceae bacterium]